jgi:hypothetical protein
LAFRTSRFSRESEHNRYRRGVKRRFNRHWWHANSYLKKRYNFWDEGTIQSLASLYYIYDDELPEADEVRHDLIGYPCPDVVITIDVDIDRVMERKLARDYHFPEEEPRLRAHFQRQKDIVDLLKEPVQDRGTKWFSLNNDFDSFEELYQSKSWKKMISYFDKCGKEQDLEV